MVCNFTVTSRVLDGTTEEVLTAMFAQYPGLKEIRVIPSKHMAFVDYENEGLAGAALQGLKNVALTPTDLLRLTYAKR